MRWKGVLLASAASLIFSLGAAQPAHADHNDRGYGYGRSDRHNRDRNKCFDKVRKEQDKLERDIRRHGWNSRQAQQRRIKVQRMRNQCADRYGWGWGRNDRRDDGWIGSDRDRRNDDWRRDDRNRRDRDRRNRDLEWWRRNRR